MLNDMLITLCYNSGSGMPFIATGWEPISHCLCFISSSLALTVRECNEPAKHNKRGGIIYQ